MSQLLYYLVLKPASYLPLSVLYRLSDFLYVLLYHLIGFRRKVVETNLTNSFPEKTPAEIGRIAKQFYRHFADLLVESIRMFSMPAEEAVRRCRVRNPEILERLYREGKSVMIPAGHYNNWELAALAVELQIPHQTIGIYAPLRNRFFNKIFTESRGRFGMELVPKQETSASFVASQNRLVAYLMGADQSPTFSRKVYWTRFLNQETAVFLGTETFAAKYDYPVVFGHILKVKRGYYEIVFEMVEEHPALAAEGSITEGHTRLLEKEILADPAYWLWTHKRWKRKKPAEVGPV